MQLSSSPVRRFRTIASGATSISACRRALCAVRNRSVVNTIDRLATTRGDGEPLHRDSEPRAWLAECRFGAPAYPQATLRRASADADPRLEDLIQLTGDS